MTAHNRCELTRRCLNSVFTQAGVQVSVILNDDGSSDGTRQLADQFPGLAVIGGSGEDYWAGGMRRAWQAMDLEATDFVALVNDDVELRPGAFTNLIEIVCRYDPCLVGAALTDPSTGLVSYGGNVAYSKLRRMKMYRVQASESPQEVHALNGNVLIMSRLVAETLQGLNPRFEHGMADYELSWRAAQHGIVSIVAPGAWGTCAPNSASGTWRDVRLTRQERWRKLVSPKGLPVRQWFYVCRRHGGPLGIIDFLAPYLRVLVGR